MPVIFLVSRNRRNHGDEPKSDIPLRAICRTFWPVRAVSQFYREKSPYWTSRFPAKWIQKTYLAFHNKNVTDPARVMGDYDLAMEGALEFRGIPREKFPSQLMFLQPDYDFRSTAWVASQRLTIPRTMGAYYPDVVGKLCVTREYSKKLADLDAESKKPKTQEESAREKSCESWRATRKPAKKPTLSGLDASQAVVPKLSSRVTLRIYLACYWAGVGGHGR